MVQEQAAELQVAVVGFGRMGAVHAKAWQETAGVRLVAVCDVERSARRGAEEEGLTAFGCLDEVLDAVSPDMVSVCTPPSSHASVASRCLAKGIHVLCEKPLTGDLASALELAAAASSSPGKLLVASKFRHVPEVTEARDRLLAGEIGRVTSFRIEFAARIAMEGRWYADPSISGGGVIIDNGWHAFDLIHFLFGGMDSVLATAGGAERRLNVEESAVIDVTAAGGETGQVVLSWCEPAEEDGYLTVRGERGSLGASWQTYDKWKAHGRMMRCFRDFANGSCQPWTSMEETAGVAAAVDASYRSLRSSQREAVRASTWTAGTLVS